MVLKLYGIPIPGRAEVTRLLLTIGNVPFEDHLVDLVKTWPELKLSTPFGQMPFLKLDDGRVVAQAGAIEGYAAKLAGLYPKDDVTAAFADQWALLSHEIVNLMSATTQLPDAAAQIKARQDLVAGKVGDKVKALAKAVEHAPYLAGSELSFADITAFVVVSTLQSGVYDGVPKTVLDDYPSLKAWHSKIADVAPIKAYYADATGVRLAFKSA